MNKKIVLYRMITLLSLGTFFAFYTGSIAAALEESDYHYALYDSDDRYRYDHDGISFSWSLGGLSGKATELVYEANGRKLS